MGVWLNCKIRVSLLGYPVIFFLYHAYSCIITHTTSILILMPIVVILIVIHSYFSIAFPMLCLLPNQPKHNVHLTNTQPTHWSPPEEICTHLPRNQPSAANWSTLSQGPVHPTVWRHCPRLLHPQDIIYVCIHRPSFNVYDKLRQETVPPLQALRGIGGAIVPK